MDGNGGMNARNWDFFEPVSLKSHLGLQLRTMEEKPRFQGGVRDSFQSHPPLTMASTNGGQVHHHRVGGLSQSHIPMEYMNAWMNLDREKYHSVIPGNYQPYYQLNYGVSPELSSAHSMQMAQQSNPLKTDNMASQMEEAYEERDDAPAPAPAAPPPPPATAAASSSGAGAVAVAKKRGGGKVPKAPPEAKKQRTRAPRVPKDNSSPPVQRSRAPKKHAEVVINGINIDISGIPIPVCSCTGTLQQCYRWGSGGWQSACCTTGLSVYPLPMSTKRRGARIAGRKMSIGAFKKVLEKLASEGYNFANPIDLKNYWAKHGTNKFVTIR